MEEHQFEEIRDLLESINDKLADITSNTSPVWGANDICDRLDKLIDLIDK